MMNTRTIRYQNSDEIGAFVKLTNAYCFVADGCDSFYSAIESSLSHDIPVIKTWIAGTRVVGNYCAGNSKGLLLPNTTNESELHTIKESLPENVVVKKIEERLCALGNCIACNDDVALAHPELDKETEEAISDALGVEVFRQTIAGQELVGSFCVFNNKGSLVNSKASDEEVDELSTLLGVPLKKGTILRGSPNVASGVASND